MTNFLNTIASSDKGGCYCLCLKFFGNVLTKLKEKFFHLRSLGIKILKSNNNNFTDKLRVINKLEQVAKKRVKRKEDKAQRKIKFEKKF